MTLKEVIEYWELFNAEIDDLLLLYRSDGACTETLEEQREAVEFTIAALRRIDALALDGKHDEGCAWCNEANEVEADNRRLWVLDASPRYYEIYVDSLTGVQYLRTYKGGVCVMVDAEGQPLIWEGYYDKNSSR